MLSGKGKGGRSQIGRNVILPRPGLCLATCMWKSGKKTTLLGWDNMCAWPSTILVWILLSTVAPVKLSELVNIPLIPAARPGLPEAFSHSQVYNVKFLEINVYLN